MQSERNFLSRAREKGRKMNNKWIFCYYLNAFLSSSMLSGNAFCCFLCLGKIQQVYEWIFCLLCVFFAFSTMPFLLETFFFHGERTRKIVEGRLLLLDDSILFRLFMLKYSWCSAKNQVSFPTAKRVFLKPNVNLNFIQSTQKHS